jgi:tyrosyl-tRNA synthetase
VEEEEIAGMQMEMYWGTVNPRDVKGRLAKEILTFFHGAGAADAAEAEFNKVFGKKELPTDMPVKTVAKSALDADGTISAVDLITMLELSPTKSESRRLIRGKAVTIDGEVLENEMARVAVKPGMVLKVGKRRFASLDIA